MAQWINLLQNNGSVLQIVSAFVVLKAGPIHLVLVGFTWKAVRQKTCSFQNPITPDMSFGYF